MMSKMSSSLSTGIGSPGTPTEKRETTRREREEGEKEEGGGDREREGSKVRVR